MAFRSLLLFLLVGLSTSDEVVVNLDGPASKSVHSDAGTTGMVSHLCAADGSSFTCKPSSAHCFNDSPVYCNFSVDLVKDISKKTLKYIFRYIMYNIITYVPQHGN